MVLFVLVNLGHWGVPQKGSAGTQPTNVRDVAFEWLSHRIVNKKLTPEGVKSFGAETLAGGRPGRVGRRSGRNAQMNERTPSFGKPMKGYLIKPAARPPLSVL